MKLTRSLFVMALLVVGLSAVAGDICSERNAFRERAKAYIESTLAPEWSQVRGCYARWNKMPGVVQLKKQDSEFQALVDYSFRDLGERLGSKWKDDEKCEVDLRQRLDSLYKLIVDAMVVDIAVAARDGVDFSGRKADLWRIHYLHCAALGVPCE
jgi:hypothetical protein